jgi:6-phosphogluconolactonase (cycloisomerase 2 family)
MRPVHLIRPLGLTAAAAGLGVALTAGLTGVAGATPTPPPPTPALFVQTDALSGNQILAYQQASDGTISLAGTYASGGLGGLETGAVADPLASQGSLTLALGGQVLLAVNAGSNSVSVFRVNGTQLTLAQTLSSEGQFPSSIAVHGSLVEVLDAGGPGKVAEFEFTGDHLAPVPGQVRTLGLDDTTVPGYLASPGEVGFTPAGSQLVVTTKLSTHRTNDYLVFSVSPDGTIGASPVITPSATAVPYSFEFDAAGHLVATEAGTSTVSTYTVNANGTLSHIGSISDGEAGLCWISLANGVAYGSNSASSTVSAFDISGSGTPTLADATAAATQAGTTDSVIDPSGSFLYVENGAAGALDVYKIGTGGALAPVETIWNLPVASEGLAVS